MPARKPGRFYTANRRLPPLRKAPCLAWPNCCHRLGRFRVHGAVRHTLFSLLKTGAGRTSQAKHYNPPTRDGKPHGITSDMTASSLANTASYAAAERLIRRKAEIEEQLASLESSLSSVSYGRRPASICSTPRMLRSSKRPPTHTPTRNSRARAPDAVVQQNGVGMQGPLVDSEGFPRTDIDVPGVRETRVRVIAELRMSARSPLASFGILELRNDLAEVMTQAEKAIHAVHAETRESRSCEMECDTAGDASGSSEGQTGALRGAENGSERMMPSYPAAFAVVNAVAPDSPAKSAVSALSRCMRTVMDSPSNPVRIADAGDYV
ncbi:MAG: hypothetical protein BJ554DRAFT_7467 [Olpidium bornovanus]|uniref:Nas2 N-terminal domain-containing protein n=1 Tax=Olpidium bornovanus TaxID=278681 RepID=A0A8H7ZW55_9FUNG|nr:MAG: hypothetical protein BJ554DRAFT_7467 [Olpidium bornovanus]